MPLILNIDTASENAHVSIANDGHILQVRSNHTQKDHASFLQTAVLALLSDEGINIKEIDAVAVTAGPGSYTGLRVGFAAAKGFCYALKAPFITVSTLGMLAASAILHLKKDDLEKVLLCPMMDARRMEVFTAVYHQKLDPYTHPCAMILDNSSFEKELTNNKVLFFGSGAAKWQLVCNHANAVFKNIPIYPEALSSLSNRLFLEKNFTSLAYSEPLYLKEFQSVI